jgi:hypothetical protein
MGAAMRDKIGYRVFVIRVEIRHWLLHRGVDLGHWFGRHVPRTLAYWAVMGLWVRATTGENGHRNAVAITAHDLLLVSEGKAPEHA